MEVDPSPPPPPGPVARIRCGTCRQEGLHDCTIMGLVYAKVCARRGGVACAKRLSKRLNPPNPWAGAWQGDGVPPRGHRLPGPTNEQAYSCSLSASCSSLSSPHSILSRAGHFTTKHCFCTFGANLPLGWAMPTRGGRVWLDHPTPPHPTGCTVPGWVFRRHRKFVLPSLIEHMGQSCELV